MLRTSSMCVPFHFVFCTLYNPLYVCVCVFVQAEQLDSISRTTVEAAENVSEGNEQIKGVSSHLKHCTFIILYPNAGHQEQGKSKSLDSLHSHCTLICHTVPGLV